MKIQTKLWLVIAGSLIVGTGSAQTWTVNGAPQSTQLTTDANQSAVAVDPVSGQVDLVTGGAVTTPTLTITAPSSVGINTTFNVSYTATNFTPVTCTASSNPTLAGWNGVLSGTTAQLSSAASGTFTLSLSCTRASGGPISAANVNVSVTNSNCPAPNISGQSSVRGAAVFATDRLFENMFDPGGPFPGESGAGSPIGPTGFRGFAVGFNEVVAIFFNMPTADLASDGALQVSENPAFGGGARPIVALSDCRGDTRDVTLWPAPRICKDGGFTGQTASISWTDNNNSFPQSFSKCRLIPGMPYYMNVSSNCANLSCGVILKTLGDTNRAEEVGQ